MILITDSGKIIPVTASSPVALQSLITGVYFRNVKGKNIVFVEVQTEPFRFVFLQVDQNGYTKYNSSSEFVRVWGQEV